MGDPIAVSAPLAGMGGSSATPAPAGSQNWLTSSSNIARDRVAPAFRAAIPSSATVSPTELGQLLFPSAYTQVKNPSSAAAPSFYTTTQPSPDIYKSYMDYAMRMLNPNLYRRT